MGVGFILRSSPTIVLGCARSQQLLLARHLKSDVRCFEISARQGVATLPKSVTSPPADGFFQGCVLGMMYDQHQELEKVSTLPRPSASMDQAVSRAIG